MEEHKQLSVVMYPWLAMGHAIPFLHLANILANKGHKVTLVLPTKPKLQLQPSNHHPSLITLHSITIPTVAPLPPGSETTADIPFHLETHLATALDRIRPEFESIIATLQPNLVFYDFAYWVPDAVESAKCAAKCVSYWVISAAAVAFSMVPFREPPKDRPVVEEDLCISGIPPGYPSSCAAVVNCKRGLRLYKPFGEGVTFYHRITAALKGGDAIVVKTYSEIEGKYCEYLSSQYDNKPVLPVLLLPEPDQAELEARWGEWLARFGPASLVFCAFGSQVVLEVDQFREILLGFEMTNLPFFVALKPPTGYTTVEEALPEGFKERIGERGVVTGEWVQQTQILAHPSVGCFVSHCGSGSIWESLMNECQIVLIPELPDQVLFSKILVHELKVAVEVVRGEDGLWVSKENVCTSIKSVMDKDSEIGNLVKKNHESLRQKLVDPQFMPGQIDNFIKDLHVLVG